MATNFFYEVPVAINEAKYSSWIKRVVDSERMKIGEINFVFCNDDYLFAMNTKYLKHDTYTDILTFDYTDGDIISGDVCISIDRVRENARIFEVDFENELQRVMAHGVLHLVGYGDKTDSEIELMRGKEDEKMKLFHVEH